MCGGRLTPLDKSTTCKCEFCGIVQSVPLLDDEDKAEMCAAAERLRREYHYDKAIELYEELIRLSPTDADLYWALALCRCGTEFADRGGVLVPTLNRTTAKSLLSDEDYKTALKYAAEEQRAAMESWAEQIDAARRRIVEISNGAEDYDVYLNCRESDENGRRTTDSLIAADIYAKLCAEGLRVFFPRVCLEDKAGADWEPYIFSALTSASVMIVVGTSAESFEDIWVRNAWSRFLTLTADSRRRIIPAFRDMEARELPRELSGVQALDMSRLGFEADLAASIGSVLGTRRESKAPASSDPLLRRARLFIEDRDYSGAEQLLAELPDSAEKYLLMLLSEYNLTSEKELEELKTDFSGSENYRKAMRLGDEGFRLRLRERNLTSIYNKCSENLENAVTDIQYRAVAAEFRVLNYRDSAEKADYAEKKAEEISEENEINRREGVYALAAKMTEESGDIKILSSAEKSLRELGDYRNAAELAEKCAAKIADLSANSPIFPVFDKKNLSLKWIVAAVGALAAAGIVIGIVVGVILKNKSDDVYMIISGTSEQLREKTEKDLNADKYKTASSLLRQGSYDEAELIFTALGEYSDASDMAKECKYQKALDMMERGDLEKAELAFTVLGDYSDSPRQLTECRYRAAVALKESGELEAAESAFIKLGDYKDSAEQLSRVRYIRAVNALAAGDTEKAEQMFLELCGYSDAATQYCKLVYADSERLVAEGDIAGACKRLEPLLRCYNYYKLDRDYWFVGKLAEAARCYNNKSYKSCIYTLEDNEELAELPMMPALLESANRQMIFTTKSSDVISFGHYPSEPDRSIKWLVISNDGEGTVVLVSKYAVFDAPFDMGNADGWENSSIRKRLNNDFLYSAFSADELELIQYTDIAADSYYTYKYPRFNETQYTGTESYADKVYLPSWELKCHTHGFGVKVVNEPSEGGRTWTHEVPVSHWVLNGIYEAMYYDDDGYPVSKCDDFTAARGICPMITLSMK